VKQPLETIDRPVFIADGAVVVGVRDATARCFGLINKNQLFCRDAIELRFLSPEDELPAYA